MDTYQPIDAGNVRRRVDQMHADHSAVHTDKRHGELADVIFWAELRVSHSSDDPRVALAISVLREDATLKSTVKALVEMASKEGDDLRAVLEALISATSHSDVALAAQQLGTATVRASQTRADDDAQPQPNRHAAPGPSGAAAALPAATDVLSSAAARPSSQRPTAHRPPAPSARSGDTSPDLTATSSARGSADTGQSRSSGHPSTYSRFMEMFRAPDDSGR